MSETSVKEVCYHCGTGASFMVEHDHKLFCCEGCAIVYDILKENNLTKYYQIEPTPGNKNFEPATNHSYDYLDQPEIKKSVLDFTDGTIARVRLFIPAIHCSSCIWLLENLHRLNKGVLHSMVNFTKKEVSITFNENLISLRMLMNLLVSLHYKPVIQKRLKEEVPVINKSLIVKLGIAGFAFGNIMLLSFPDYFSYNLTFRDPFIRSFGWISLLLSLPVLLYSASDYHLSAWKNLVNKSISINLPIAIGIFVIFFRSLYEIVSGEGAGYLDSLTGLVFFMLIGKWFQDRTYQALSFENDYSLYFPLGVNRLNENGEIIVPIQELIVGDLIRIRNNEIIPTDSLLQDETLLVDYSFITGESAPVQKIKGDLIYAGGRLLGKSAILIVHKDVESGYLVQLWKEQIYEEKSSSFLSETLNKVSKYFTLVILIFAVATALFWYFTDASKIVLTFTSVLIIACPCALALVIPFAYGHGRSILGKNQFFIRHASLIEKLSKVDTLVFDKTGTLTDSNSFDVEYYEIVRNEFVPQLISSLACQSTHPLSRAIFLSLKEEIILPINDFEELIGYGLKATIGEYHVKMGSALFLGVEDLSVLRSARVYVSINEVISGYFELKNHYRQGWKELLQNLSKRFEVHILSGDNDAERKTLENAWVASENIRFNQSPKEKLVYIRDLKAKGKNVVMLGDGLNDAGALKESNVGISVADDVFRFSPSSDAIIKANELKHFLKFIAFTHTEMKIVTISFIISFLYNIIGLSYAASGQLSPLVAAILMPLSSITVVTFTTFASQLMARAKEL